MIKTTQIKWQTALRWPRWKRVLALLVAGGLAVKLSVWAILTYMQAAHPLPLDRFHDQSSVLLDDQGGLLHLSRAGDGRRRTLATVDGVSPNYIKALIDFEDRRFWSHDGVDTLALMRASVQALTNGRVVSGGSTISMQTVKLLEPRPRTLSTKIIEIFRAWQLETAFSKQEILSFYMTLAPMGGNIEGVRTASLLYFGREPKDLTLAETALLVALPQNPSRLDPRKYPRNAVMARNKIALRIQKAFGASDDALMAVSKSPIIQRKKDANLIPLLADKIARPKVTLKTSIQSVLQADTRTLLQKHLVNFDPDANITAIVMDAKTRQVIAYVGSAAYGSDQRKGYINMATASRSPGSTLKPIIYGLAMDEHLIQMNTRIRDEETNFNTYSPVNFNKKFRGETTIKQALQLSLNIPAVKVLERIGPRRFTDKLANSGVVMDFPKGAKPSLPIALGGIGISLERMMQLYAALADDGTVTPLAYNSQSVRPKGQTLINPTSRADIHSALLGTRSPYANVPELFAATKRTVAFKTGTSYGHRDAWAMGFKGKYVIGIWVGKASGQPHAGHYGINTAAPILMDIAALLPSVTAPKAVTTTAWAELPRHQQHFDDGYSLRKLAFHNQTPSITYPYDGSMIAFDLNKAITVQIKHGVRPFRWYANGKRLNVSPLKRTIRWQASNAGFHDLVVIDKMGRKATVSIRLKSDS